MRLKLLVAAILILGLTLFVPGALATKVSWTGGYNYLTPDFPVPCRADWSKGCTQSGFNNWDWSGMTKLGGECVSIGFRDVNDFFYNAGTHYCEEWNGAGDFHVSRTGVGAPPYNRGYCAYWSGGQSYATCWTDIH